MLTVWYVLTQAMFVYLIATTIPDFKQKTKANISRAALIILLVAVSAVLRIFMLGGS